MHDARGRRAQRPASVLVVVRASSSPVRCYPAVGVGVGAMANSQEQHQVVFACFCAFLLGIPPTLKRWRDSEGLTGQKVRSVA